MKQRLAGLAKLSAACGLKVAKRRLEKLLAYIDLVESAGRRLGLASRPWRAGAPPPHLVKSVFLAARVFHVERNVASGWLDIGSGGGYPALVMRILTGAGSLTLLEPRLKRSVFLEETVRLLGLRGVRVVRGRAERQGKVREGYCLCTAQGIGPLAHTLELVMPLLAVGGRYVCWRGRDMEEELKRWGKVFAAAGGSVREKGEIVVNGRWWANILIVEKVGITFRATGGS